jgi:hypothetical protein
VGGVFECRYPVDCVVMMAVGTWGRGVSVCRIEANPK